MTVSSSTSYRGMYNNNLDYDRQQLSEVEQEITGLIVQRGALKKQERQQGLTPEEQEELVGVERLLADAKENAEFYRSLIKLSIKDEPPVSKSFSEADRSWIQSVTLVNTDYRRWTDYTIDVNIQPRDGFQTKLEELAKAFNQVNEAGRRVYLNLFLSDIILRKEFDDNLRIFLDVNVTVGTKGLKKRWLHGIMDYTVGKGKDIFDKPIPQEFNLVALESKTDFPHDDVLQIVAQAASLYKTRVDAQKQNKSVWGILSNAEFWQFIFIDEVGHLWQSDYFVLNLRFYDESKMLQMYRMIHYIMKCCHEAMSDPPSLPSSVVSLHK